MAGKFGAFSVQVEDCCKDLLRFDDLDPKNRAGKFRDFLIDNCAAKAFYSCPAIISQRLESRITSNEPQENTEEESKII
jgi:hypothetical protein